MSKKAWIWLVVIVVIVLVVIFATRGNGTTEVENTEVEDTTTEQTDNAAAVGATEAQVEVVVPTE